MKATTGIFRILVGVLFIFSGLVKANDPLSLGYKMQEFFEIWNESLAKGSFFLNRPLVSIFDFFHAHSLALAVFMIALEIIAGAALILGWRMKLFSRLLLLMIIFFTFLTGYALLSGKFKNCGCFGDCLPITPKASFIKDLLLTAMIGFLFWQRKQIRPLFSEQTNTITMMGVTLVSFGIQWYTLSYLPIADCLPFKKGKNIPEQMKMPANAVPDSTVITFVYVKDGTIVEFPADSVPKNLSNDFLFVKKENKEITPDSSINVAVYVKGGRKIEFTSNNFPTDYNARTYQFLKRYDKIVRKGKNNEPPIKSFTLSGITDEDSTMIVLQQPYAILLFCENFSTPVRKWKNDFSKLYEEAKAKNIPAFMVTTQPGEAINAVAGTPFATIPVLKCDYTAIRTAARTIPCLYLLKEGTIMNKWSYKSMGSALKSLKKIPVQNSQ